MSHKILQFYEFEYIVAQNGCAPFQLMQNGVCQSQTVSALSSVNGTPNFSIASLNLMFLLFNKSTECSTDFTFSCSHIFVHSVACSTSMLDGYAHRLFVSRKAYLSQKLLNKITIKFNKFQIKFHRCRRMIRAAQQNGSFGCTKNYGTLTESAVKCEDSGQNI